MRVGQPRELGWAATFLCSPYARFISGHTLVVDGANWQRRALTDAAGDHGSRARWVGDPSSGDAVRVAMTAHRRSLKGGCVAT